MGGLENTMSLKEQYNLFTKNINNEVIPHSYKDIDKLKNNINKSPNSKVVLFSAGGKNANEVVNLVNNPNQIYIIEPYTCNRTITQKIPKKNILGGSDCKTGNNVAGIFRADIGSKGHFDSLEKMAKLIK